MAKSRSNRHSIHLFTVAKCARVIPEVHAGSGAVGVQQSVRVIVFGVYRERLRVQPFRDVIRCGGVGLAGKLGNKKEQDGGKAWGR